MCTKYDIGRLSVVLGKSCAVVQPRSQYWQNCEGCTIYFHAVPHTTPYSHGLLTELVSSVSKTQCNHRFPVHEMLVAEAAIGSKKNRNNSATGRHSWTCGVSETSRVPRHGKQALYSQICLERRLTSVP